MITNNKNPRFSYLRRLVILPLLAIVVVLVAFRSKSVDPTKPLSVGSLMETVADKIKGNQKNTSLQLSRTFNLNKTYTVVIDAGHGGTDHGALSATEKITEAELTLQLAKAVKEANTNQNIKIILTRESDVFNSVVEKADFANAQNPDYFISLHINADEKNVKATGVEFIIPQNDQSKRYVQSGQLAGNFGVALSEYSVNVNKIHSVEKGVWILKSVKCPSVLIEAGYITNASDLNKLKDKDYQNKMALAILQGLNSYLSNSEKYANRPIIDTAIVRAKDSSKNNSFVVVSDSIIFRETGKKPLIILDGKVQPNTDINKINPNSIEKIDVLKNESATKVYGDAGKNGVIIITSKVAAKESLKKPIEPYSGPIPKNVVYYVDGVKSDSNVISKINPNNIASINVWKEGGQVYNKYDVEPGVGVIEIVTKKAAEFKTVQDLKLEKVQVSYVPHDVFVNLDGHSTVFFGPRGGSNAAISSLTDLIIVNGKLMSPGELNGNYKHSDFIQAAAFDAGELNGKNKKGVLFLSSTSMKRKEIEAMIEKVLAENGK
jgi:N-acetylmuramoyl-L-alanine amidase